MPISPAYLAALKAGMQPGTGPLMNDPSTQAPGLPSPLASSAFAEQAAPLTKKKEDEVLNEQAFEQSIADMKPSDWVAPAQINHLTRTDSQLRKDMATVDPNLTKQEQSDAKYRAAPLGAGIPGADPAVIKASQEAHAAELAGNAPSTDAAAQQAAVPAPAAPAAPHPVTIAAHDVNRISPADQKAILAAQKGVLDAQGGTVDADLKTGMANAIGANLVQAKMEQQARDTAKFEADRLKEQDQKQHEFESFSKEVGKDKLDPNRWASNASFGQKFAFVLASALGGWASSKNGGPNVGLEAIKGEINKDLEAQKSAIEARKGRLGDMKGAVAEAYRRTGDMRQAMALAQGQALKSAELQANQFAAGAKSETVYANHKVLSAELAKEYADQNIKFHQYAQAQTIGGGVPGAVKPNPEQDKLFVPDGPHGQGFYAKSEKEAQEARGIVEAQRNLLPLLDRLKTDGKEVGVLDKLGNKVGYESDAIGRVKASQNLAVTGFKNLEKAGALDAGTQELAKDIIGDYTKFGAAPEAKVDAFKAYIANKVAALKQAQAAQTATQGIVVDSNGRNIATSVGGQSLASPPAAMPAFKKVGP